jgi:hypothetical protein
MSTARQERAMVWTRNYDHWLPVKVEFVAQQSDETVKTTVALFHDECEKKNTG